MKVPKIFIPFCLVCGLVVGAKNFAALERREAGPDLPPPQWSDGLLQRPDQRALQGAELLCFERSCGDVSPWPVGDDPSDWLQSLGFSHARQGQRELPQAPALIRHPDGWMLLITEASDRLEVVLEKRGGGLWRPERWASLRGLPWWGPLR